MSKALTMRRGGVKVLASSAMILIAGLAGGCPKAQPDVGIAATQPAAKPAVPATTQLHGGPSPSTTQPAAGRPDVGPPRVGPPRFAEAEVLGLLMAGEAQTLDANLRRLQTPEALPALRDILDDPAKPEHARRHAAHVLGLIGSPEARDVLIAALSATATPPLGDGRELWSRLVEAVARCVEKEPERLLLADLGHPNPQVRWLAAMQVGKRKCAAAAGALVRMLDDKSSDPRLGATWALGEIQDPRGLSELVAIVEKRRLGGSRISAIEAMGKAATPRCIEALRSVTADDPDYWMAVKALEALASQPSASATQPADPTRMLTSEWVGRKDGLMMRLEVYPATFRLGERARVQVRLAGRTEYRTDADLIEFRFAMRANGGRFACSTLREFALDKILFNDVWTLDFQPWGPVFGFADVEARPGPADMALQAATRKSLDPSAGSASAPIETWQAKAIPLTILPRRATPPPTDWVKALDNADGNRLYTLYELHDAYEPVRKAGRASPGDRFQHAPPMQAKGRNASLDDWFDTLLAREFSNTPADDNWLLFRGKQLNDNDLMWIERIERKKHQFFVVAHKAAWDGEYEKNVTWYPVLGVNLGKLPPGQYTARWSVRTCRFTELDEARMPRDEELIETERSELETTFKVVPAASTPPAPAAGS